MTLILSVISGTCALQVSDRKLTGTAGDAELTKTTCFVCRDGRFAVSFTGLASAPGYEIDTWLPQALSDAAKPDHLCGPTFARLRDLATARFKVLPASRRDKRLTISLAGFQNEGLEQSRGYCYRISNFQGPDLDGDARAEADETFSCDYFFESLPLGEAPVMVMPSAEEPLMTQEDLEFLASATKRRDPPDVLLERTVTLVRRVAQRREARGAIGGTCIGLVIPRDLSAAATGSFHPEGAAMEIFAPNYVRSLGDGMGDMQIRGVTSAMLDERRNPIALVQRVGRNKPCPCGSGRKYKKCHGGPPDASGLRR